MDSNSNEILADAASKTALGVIDRFLSRMSGRGNIRVHRLTFSPVNASDENCMFDLADRLKVYLNISLYSTKSISTRIYEPTLIFRMKRFRELRLNLAKIDITKPPEQIIEEQHVLLLKPNENRTEVFNTYIIEKDRLIVIKEPHSRFDVYFEYRAEGRAKTRVSIMEYFLFEIQDRDIFHKIETRYQQSHQSWKWYNV